jgi:hypothetical protein
LAQADIVDGGLNPLEFGPEGLGFGVLGGQRVLLIDGLKIAIDEVRQQRAEEVRERHLTILVMVQASAQGLDVRIRHHVPPPVHHQKPFDLRLVYLALIFGVHGLEKFSDLEVTSPELRSNNARMELLNLSLNFLLDLHFALKQFGKSAHDFIAALLNVMHFLFLDFLQELGCNLLAALWNDEIDKPTN